MGKAKHITISVLLWLTISPLFLYSTRKWHQLNWPLRIILLLISPLFLSMYGLTLAILLSICFGWWPAPDPEDFHAYMFEHYSNSEVFEQSTGVRLSPFKVIEYELSYFNQAPREFNYNLTIEFDDPLSDDFYQYLDSLVAVDDNWISSPPPISDMPSPFIQKEVVMHNNTEVLLTITSIFALRREGAKPQLDTALGNSYKYCKVG